ncbi:MAG: polyprenyl diphosphate synthase [Candidatus Levyibacteriota bacterium]
MNNTLERLSLPIREFSQRIKTRAIETVIFHHKPKAPEPSPQSVWERFPELKEIPVDRFPKHIFIIPDGNRRSARERGQESIEGHVAGYRKVMEVLEVMHELPVDMVTIWAFSDHNWGRPESEKANLMSLFGTALTENTPKFMENNVRFTTIGRKDRIPKELAEKFERTEELTKENTGQTVCIAIDFGGEDHEERVVKQSVIDGVALGRDNPELTPEEIADLFDQKKIRSFYDGEGKIPAADLIMRTSEKRTSDPGFLEGAETELWFIDEYLPNSEVQDFINGIVYFASVERRFGK